jgi:putative flippase GtrA
VLAGLAPLPALVITYVVGTLINYVTTGRFVFGTRDLSGLARFIAAYVVIYFFNWGMFHAVSQAVPQPLLAQALCIPVVAVFSFVLFKRFVFKR